MTTKQVKFINKALVPLRKKTHKNYHVLTSLRPYIPDLILVTPQNDLCYTEEVLPVDWHVYDNAKTVFNHIFFSAYSSDLILRLDSRMRHRTNMFDMRPVRI